MVDCCCWCVRIIGVKCCSSSLLNWLTASTDVQLFILEYPEPPRIYAALPAASLTNKKKKKRIKTKLYIVLLGVYNLKEKKSESLTADADQNFSATEFRLYNENSCRVLCDVTVHYFLGGWSVVLFCIIYIWFVARCSLKSVYYYSRLILINK